MSASTLRILFYGFWLLALGAQAFFTDLWEDEAYYWMYSRQLAWGYFDHPPVIAVFVKLGYALFKNELGVRLLSILAAVSSIAIWEKLAQPKNLKLFYAIVSSIAVLHFIGFMAIPDAPLLFFSTLFFWAYRAFLANPSWHISAMLAMLIALMMLSKYHAIVIIGLTVLANLKLFKSKYFWGIVGMASILLLPHVWWQIQNDFPSINYHLNERHNRPWEWNFTGYYLLFQPWILGPVTGILLFIAAWRFRAKDLFDRTMLFVYWGGYLFFFILSFRSWIEGHWTLFTVIPGIYIGYRQLAEMPKLRSVFKFSLPVALLLILGGRLLLLVNLLPQSPFLAGFHGKKEWAKAIQQVADKTPVAFINSFQKASLYTFYSGAEGFSLNTWAGRKNQFTLWDDLERYRGKQVIIVSQNKNIAPHAIPGTKPAEYYFVEENFQTFTAVRAIPVSVPQTVQAADTLILRVALVNSEKRPLDVNLENGQTPVLAAIFAQGTWAASSQELALLQNAMLGDTLTLKIGTPATPGSYHLLFVLKSGHVPALHNSNRYTINVLPRKD